MPNALHEQVAGWFKEVVRRGRDHNHSAFTMLHGSDRSGKYLRFLPGSERRYLRREVRREKKRERRAIATWEREHGKWD